MDSTPAICAGTTFMTTLDSRGASPPGTYRPTRRTGIHRSVTVPPGTTWVVTSVRRWSACTRRTRAIASSSAARRVASHSASARSSSSCGTAKVARSTPSSRAVISRTACAPRSRTSSQSGRTVASTESMSVAARGSRPASSRIPGNVDPRRSMRASTGHLRCRTPGPSVASGRRRPLPRPSPADRRLGGVGELIPLFPLGSPLFPGVVLPLNVFEPRYLRLVEDLVALPPASERRFFGVVAIRQGWEGERIAPAAALYDVGCAARLQGVRPEPDGGFRIVTVGGERVRPLDVVVGGGPPYLRPGGGGGGAGGGGALPPRPRGGGAFPRGGGGGGGPPAVPAGRGGVARRGGGRAGGGRRRGRAGRHPARRTHRRRRRLGRPGLDGGAGARRPGPVRPVRGGGRGVARRRLGPRGRRGPGPRPDRFRRRPRAAGRRRADRRAAARGGRRPAGAVLAGRLRGAAHDGGPAGPAGGVGDPQAAGRGGAAAAPRAHPPADPPGGAGAAAGGRPARDPQLSPGRPRGAPPPPRPPAGRPRVPGQPRGPAAGGPP